MDVTVFRIIETHFPASRATSGTCKACIHFYVIVDRVQIQERFLRYKVFRCEHPSLRDVCAFEHVFTLISLRAL